jgi:YesN/AraC family two-component response regulator
MNGQPGRKILMADDNRELCADFRLWFSEYDITAVHSAEEALALLARPNSFRLVILDVEMPGMGGLAAMEKVRGLAPEAGIIIMTAYSTKDTAIKALRGRAAGYVEKPFALKEMREAIERELGAGQPAADDSPAGRIERVKRYVEANCFKKVTLSDAAAEVFVTPKYLSREFRRHAGMGFTSYRLKVKVEKAQEVLRAGGASIKQLAARLGYANPESFIRQFNRLTGCLPSSFRKTGSCPMPKPSRRRAP